MAFKDAQIQGAFGPTIPQWLEEWLMSTGAMSSPQVSTPQANPQSSTPSYFNAQQYTPPYIKPQGDGFNPNFANNSFPSNPALSFQQGAQAIFDGLKSEVNGLKSSIQSEINGFSKEVTEFFDNPIESMVQGAGFRTGNEVGVYSDVGLMASNMGTAAEKSTPLTGLFGTLAAGGAGLIETKQLNEAMGRKGKTADGQYETWEGVPEEDQLGFWDQINAWLTPNTLNSIATDRFSYANSPENFANFPGTITPQQAFYNAQAASAGGNWTGAAISTPNAANNPYGPQWGGARTATTPEEVNAVHARANNIAAQQAAVQAAVAAASSQAPHAVSNLSSQPTDPSYYGTYTPDVSGGGGGFSGGSGGGYNDNDTSYSEGWD